MTCRGKLDLARRHAALCDEIERCAPAVHGTKLREALERLQHDVCVTYDERFVVALRLLPAPHDLFAIHYEGPSSAEATAAYFALVATLTNSLPATATAVPPLTQEPGTAGVGSALTSAFSSRPAAVTPSDAPAATPGVAPPSDAGRPNSGGC